MTAPTGPDRPGAARIAAERARQINAVSPVPGQQREAVARWLEREYVGLIDDESWQGCLDAADELLALLAATQDGGQA